MADSPACPIPQPATEHNSQQSQRCLHRDFAVQNQRNFRWRARQLAPDDRGLQDDLVQEMSLAVLQYDKPAHFGFLFELATNRAKNYLIHEASHGQLSLTEVQEPTDKLTEKIESLNIFIEEQIERGVPREWIEEVIGYRLEVA